VVAIAAGEFHSLALRNDGTVVAWGYDYYGQADVPAGLTNVVDVGAGSLFSAALKDDGTSVAWGIAGPNSPPEGFTGSLFLSASNRQCLVISGAPFSPGSWVDNSVTEDGFKIERAPDAGGSAGTWAEVATVGPNVTAWTNTGLAELTRYWFRIHAYNSSADSPLSNLTNAMTQLGAPSDFTATAISANQVVLSWTDYSSLENGFVIDSASSPTDRFWLPIATNAANVTAFTYTNASCTKIYYYRVHALRGITNSDYSSIISNNTAAADSDGDDVPDCWMLTYFHHPTGQAADQSRTTEDADHDGLSNLQEYLAGTNPTNAASALRITSLAAASNGVRLSWTTGRQEVCAANQLCPERTL
jgi:hypothetical protein